jgi:hypothetical protein
VDHFRTRTKQRSIALLVVCEAMALALWFSATAIIPVLKLHFPIDDARASLFSSIVAVGYVVGTLGEQPTRLPILRGESPLSVNCPDLDG